MVDAISGQMPLPEQKREVTTTSEQFDPSSVFTKGYKTLKREVNGGKEEIYVGQDQSGNTVRKNAQGEELIVIDTRGKNSYITKSEFQQELQNQFGTSDLPEGVNAQYKHGKLVFTYCGNVITSDELKNMIAAQNAEKSQEVEAESAPVDNKGTTTDVTAAEEVVTEEVVTEADVDSDIDTEEPVEEEPVFSRELFKKYNNRVTVDETGSTQRLTKNKTWQAAVALPKNWNGEGAPSKISVALPGDYGEKGKDGVAQKRYQTLRMVDSNNNVYQDSAGVRSFQLSASEDGITLKQIHYENGQVSDLTAADSSKTKTFLNETTATIEQDAIEHAQKDKSRSIGSDKKLSHEQTIITIKSHEDAMQVVGDLADRNTAWGTYTAAGSNRGTYNVKDNYGLIEYLLDTELTAAGGKNEKLSYSDIKPALQGLMARVPEKYHNNPNYLSAQALIAEADAGSPLKARALDKNLIQLARQMDIQGTNYMPNEYLRSGNSKVMIVPEHSATEYYTTDAQFQIPTQNGSVKKFYFYRDDTLYDKCYDFQDVIGQDQNGNTGLITNDSTGNNRKGVISFNAEKLDANEQYYFQTKGGRRLNVIVDANVGYIEDKSGKKIPINDILNGLVPMPD